MDRKEFIKYTGSVTAFALFGGFVSFLESCKKHGMDMAKSISVIIGNFDNPLRTLPILDGLSPINFTAKRNTATIIKGKTSQVYGYNGEILAPIIKVSNGQTLSVALSNQLEEVTNIHWHGLIIPESMDGHPKNTIQPGGSFNYQFTINQKAGTNWFHPHPHQITAKQVYKGLAGMLIINDSDEAALNLPSGEFEIPLVLQDKRIYSDGSLNYSPDMMDIMSGYLGQYVCVNGIWSPFFNVKTKIYRLRILNGSNARAYNLAFSNGINFSVIGSDVGLLGNTQTINTLLIAPGERVDVLVDFSSITLNSEFYLESRTFSGGDSQGIETFKIIKFIISELVAETFIIPNSLVPFSPISSSLSTKTRSFDISNPHGAMGGGHGGHSSMHTIGGKSFDMNRIDETVSVGATEIWEFDNSNGLDLHPMHMHGVHFQVLSRMGGRNTIQPHETGWKDTVLCLPGEKIQVIVTFPNNPGVFVFHCHNLEHEDSGMMLNFKIV